MDYSGVFRAFKDSPNEGVARYLVKYIKISQPRFAVLLKGEWGSGKTWFIQKFIRSLKSSNNSNIIMYVSLFGIKDRKEIDQAILRSMYPYLNYGVNSLSKISEVAFKLTLGPNIKLRLFDKIRFKSLLKFKNKILVFDDLERCDIGKNALFGYIDQFLQNGNNRIIVIGHEEKLHESETNTPSHKKDLEPDNPAEDPPKNLYREIKEKLIGQTFEITSNLEALVSSEVEILDFDAIQKDRLKRMIILVNRDGGNRNLRAISQLIKEFVLFEDILPLRLKQTDHLYDSTIYEYFRFGYELKVNNETIEGLFSGLMNFDALKPVDNFDTIFLNPGKKEDPRYKLRSQYRSPIDIMLWKEYFEVGQWNLNNLKTCLDKSKYFNNDDTPWYNLWRPGSLTEEKYQNYRESSLKILKNVDYLALVNVIEIVGVFNWLNSIGLVKDNSLNNILTMAKKSAEKFIKTHQSKSEHLLSNYPYSHHSFRIVNDLNAFIRSECKSAFEASFADKADELINLIMSNDKVSIDKFEALLDPSKSNDSVYVNLPIFKDTNALNFFNLLTTIDPEIHSRVKDIFIGRYENLRFHSSSLVSESRFIRDLSLLLAEYATKNPGTLKGYRSKLFSDGLKEVAHAYINEAERKDKARHETISETVSLAAALTILL